jgi:beta-N-acetylhexosaminidase
MRLVPAMTGPAMARRSTSPLPEAWLTAKRREAARMPPAAASVEQRAKAAILTRSYGSDPELVAAMGAASVEGFEDAGVVSAAKHFPNHGPALVDSHTGRPVVDHDASKLRSHDLPPFRAAIRAGAPMVMVGHLVYPALDQRYPASLSPEAYRVLREELSFEGVAVTDDLAMEGATRGGTTARAAVAAVEAGADLLVISSVPQEQADAYDAVVAAVESGRIPRERIDETVERIRRLKAQYGMSGATRGG